MSIIRPQIVHVPKLKEYTINPVSLQLLLRPSLYNIIHILDNNYWYVIHEDWGRVFQDVFLNMPTYVAEKFDCDNFAMYAVSEVARKYHLNGIGMVIGSSPMGYHAFNVFIGMELSGNPSVHYLEPQTGMVYPVDNIEGYKADIIII